MVPLFGRTLRAHILSIVLFGAVLPLALVGAWLTRGGVRSGEDLLHRQLDASIENVMRVAVRRWEDRRADLLMLAESPPARRLAARQPTASDSAFLARAAGVIDRSITSFEYDDGHGVILWASPRAVQPAESPVAASPVDPLVELEFSVPRDGGGSAGLLRARLKLSGLIPPDTGRIGVPGSLVGIQDRRRGSVIVALDDSLPFPSPGRRRLRGADWLAVEREASGLPIRVALAAPLAPYVAPFEHAALVGTAALILVALVALGATTVLTTRLSRSVNALADAADAVSAGDLSRDVGAAAQNTGLGPVEMQRLARAFSRMTVSLRDVLAELSQRRALAAVGEFASALSHEVRNALTPVEVDLERAQERSFEDARTHALIGRALSQVRRLEEAVSAALGVARSGFVARERVDLNEVLRAAVRHAEPSFRDTGSTVSLCDGGSPIWIDGDSNALRQLFTNLLVNAGQALTAPGHATIHTSPAADRVTVAIVDDGPGISDEIMPRVDQPFFTTRPNGTGLGLPIARQIAKAHGGALEIHRASGRGTEVRVTLPLVRAG